MPKIFLLRDQMLEQHQELLESHQGRNKGSSSLWLNKEPPLFHYFGGERALDKEKVEEVKEVEEPEVLSGPEDEPQDFFDTPCCSRILHHEQHHHIDKDLDSYEVSTQPPQYMMDGGESLSPSEKSPFHKSSFNFKRFFDFLGYKRDKYEGNKYRQNDLYSRSWIYSRAGFFNYRKWNIIIYFRLSPKCVYSSGPPHKSSYSSIWAGGYVLANGNGSSSTGNYFQSNNNVNNGGGTNGTSNNGYYNKQNGGISNNNNNNNNNGILDFDNFDYPDSPTQKWLADNADLSPLTVLDNINLKTEFPYASNQIDIDKPPDIHQQNMPMDGAPIAENLLQFAVSVPSVPQQPQQTNSSSSSSPSTASFLDIGGDSFTQSLYDDLGDISLNEFGNNPNHQLQIQSLNMVPHNNNHPENILSTATNSKPITLEKIESNESPFHNFIHLTDLARIKSTAAAAAAAVAAAAAQSPDLINPIHPHSQGPPVPQPSQSQQHLDLANLLSSGPPSVNTNDSVLKGLMEPIPSSALKGLIKVEPISGSASPPNMSNTQGIFDQSFIKMENVDSIHQSCSSSTTSSGNDSAFSPLSMVHSPSSPTPSNAGKVKSPSRKKSSSSTSSSSSSFTIMTAASGGPTNEDDDISNIPSLQMRIQIISQRLGIPPNSPIELINGGHGIKNPMSSGEVPEKIPVDKLPPARPESDPSKFQCRICSKIFTLQRLLNRHMKCHSDTKRYLCTFCGKGFNDTFDLKRHTRTHTGVRPYKCNLCEKSFTQRCSLESHCLKVHGVAHQYDYKQRRSKMYVCEDCGHTTPEPEVHYIHLKENHPYSPALLKFYDKRHFKFSNSNFASMLLQVNS
uniref:C2H2-type domain-containing protein n=1 Tax=Lepeophtheirus salmonis TaxID=72036 RepID=A0A0K2UY51_LEPSM